MKVLLTGGSGFIGSALLRALSEQSDIELYALEHKRKLPNLTHPPKVISGGISSLTTQQLESIAPDTIIHLARPTFPRLKMLGRKLAGYFGNQVNHAFMRRIQSLKNTPRLIYISGSLMYGSSSDKAFKEDAPLNPISYAKDYLRSELPILDYLETKPEHTLILRAPWVIGNGSWFKWIYLDSIEQHKTVPLFGDGKNLMHFIALPDLVELTIQMMRSETSLGIRNVYSPTILTQESFVNQLAELTGSSIDQNVRKYESAIYEAFTSSITLDSIFHDIDYQHIDMESYLESLLTGLLKNKQ